MAAKKPRKTTKTARAKKTSPRKAATKPAVAKSRAAGAPLTLRSAAPSFTVNDLQKSLAWYRDVLGCQVEEEWKNDEGVVRGMSLKAGDVSFMIGQDDWQKGRDRKKGEGFRIFCETKGSVDDIARRIQSKGGRLDQGPTDQPWGMRDISVTDPDGFKITIAKNLS
ncbi:MAG TPA: VOC family protein [Thermoanaerobaculia bacterium]|jgi:catechol 2,3-dioxygenase-like lactoylglutathione lyase family enzyme|nr:VOC family protein [Thermoanaerobaculia bacterium]